MRRIGLGAALVLIALAPACKSGPGWNNDDALAATKLEIQLDKSGRMVEVEYHMKPEHVPANIREAMAKLHPGGRFTDAEKEWNGGKLYWELSATVRGMEVEAMFTPDGMLYRQEVQVPAAKVPAAVRDAASRAVAGGRIRKWEEIRSADALLEYHTKIDEGGNHWKVAIKLDGTVRGVWRETPAEVEVTR